MTLATEILADSPLGFWKLDETSGTTATDSSGSARHGTYTSSSMVGAGPGPCAVGGVSAHFGGPSEYVTVPSDAAWSLSTVITVEALVRMTHSSFPFGAIISHDPFIAAPPALGDAAADDCYNVYAMLNGVEVESNNRTPFLDGTLPCEYFEKWAHIVVTKSGSGSTGTHIYLNGVLVATGAVPNFETGVRGLFIGRRGYPSLYLVGDLSHVAIYGSALSAARVTAHATAASCPGLCGPFPLRLRQRRDNLNSPRLPRFHDSRQTTARLGAGSYW